MLILLIHQRRGNHKIGSRFIVGDRDIVNLGDSKKRFDIWIVRLGLALVLVPRMGLRGMWIAMAIELCVRGLLMLFRQLTTKYYEKYKKEPV